MSLHCDGVRALGGELEDLDEDAHHEIEGRDVVVVDEDLVEGGELLVGPGFLRRRGEGAGRYIFKNTANLFRVRRLRSTEW
jgi:hypothetical protein